MKINHDIEHSEIRDIVGSGSFSLPACVATAGTTLIIGFVPNSLLLLHMLMLYILKIFNIYFGHRNVLSFSSVVS